MFRGYWKKLYVTVITFWSSSYVTTNIFSRTPKDKLYATTFLHNKQADLVAKCNFKLARICICFSTSLSTFEYIPYTLSRTLYVRFNI